MCKLCLIMEFTYILGKSPNYCRPISCGVNNTIGSIQLDLLNKIICFDRFIWRTFTDHVPVNTIYTGCGACTGNVCPTDCLSSKLVWTGQEHNPLHNIHLCERVSSSDLNSPWVGKEVWGGTGTLALDESALFVGYMYTCCLFEVDVNCISSFVTCLSVWPYLFAVCILMHTGI